jgi:hypothetical protein
MPYIEHMRRQPLRFYTPLPMAASTHSLPWRQPTRLSPGWNIIGDPFNAAVPLTSLTLDSGSETYTEGIDVYSYLIGKNVYAYDHATMLT